MHREINGRIDPTALVRAAAVDLADDVVIGAGVRIACDRLTLGAGAVIGRGTRIVTPEFCCGRGGRIGADCVIETNEACVFGAFADVGRDVRIVAHSVHAGDHLWMTDRVLVGGGGARGPRARLRIGDRSAIMDGCLINVCEAVAIGSDSALSHNVMVLTHSTWHPVLAGGSPLFAPVSIGDNVIVFVNAVIAPGVTIGRDCTVGAGAVVTREVPDGATVFGNPARVVMASPAAIEAAQLDAIVVAALDDYSETIPVKGGSVARLNEWSFAVSVEGEDEIVRYEPANAAGVRPVDARASITLSAGEPGTGLRGRCHFDVVRRTMTGTPSLISEDLRDFLRRRTIRIYTDRPFRSLPSASIARLARQLDS